MKGLIRRLSKVADSSEYVPLRTADKRRTRVPAGHVPLFVGEEMERFNVRAELLSRPAFIELLRRSATEYGYDQVGVLRIPYPVHLFRRLLLAVDSDFGDDLAAVELARCFANPDPTSCYA